MNKLITHHSTHPIYIYIHCVVFNNINIYLIKDLLTPSGAIGLALNCRSIRITSI